MPKFKKLLDLLKTQDNKQLVQAAQVAGAQHREQMIILITHLTEVANRNLFGELGYSSLNNFAIKELKIVSSSSAHRYCEVAMLAKEFPEVLDMIAAGELSLETAGEVRRTFREEDRVQSTTAEKLREKAQMQSEMSLNTEQKPHEQKTTRQEKREALHSIKNLSRKEAERKLAEKFDRSQDVDRPASYVKSCQGNWNLLTVALSDEELALFDKLRGLLSHKTGTGSISDTQLRMMMEMLEKHDPAQIQERADRRMEKQLDREMQKRQSREMEMSEQMGKQSDLEMGKQSDEKTVKKNGDSLGKHDQAVKNNHVEQAQFFSSDKRPTKKVSQPGQSLRINSRILRAKAEERCQYVSQITGRRCDQTQKLDVDHRVPKCRGGGDELENLQLLCRHHNRTIKGGGVI